MFSKKAIALVLFSVLATTMPVSARSNGGGGRGRGGVRRPSGNGKPDRQCRREIRACLRGEERDTCLDGLVESADICPDLTNEMATCFKEEEREERKECLEGLGIGGPGGRPGGGGRPGNRPRPGEIRTDIMECFDGEQAIEAIQDCVTDVFEGLEGDDDDEESDEESDEE